MFGNSFFIYGEMEYFACIELLISSINNISIDFTFNC